ncbi:mCG1026325 [Mus musculus]|nr:mCG1026325 [Mus musculus]
MTLSPGKPTLYFLNHLQNYYDKNFPNNKISYVYTCVMRGGFWYVVKKALIRKIDVK